MARQKLVVGTYGDINCTKRANGTWLARARYCDVDGVVREYRKSGETKNKARANLKAFFVEHTGTFGDGAIAPDDTVQQLLDLWFAKMENADGGPISETLERYRYHMRWVLDNGKTEHPLGAYQLRHIRPVIIQAALDSAGVSADMRKRISSVLVRAFNMAIFHEALNGNPATAVPSVPVPKVKKKPVAVEDLDPVRAAIREWANAERRNGPKSVDLPDIVDMLIATGMPIGEVLALRWSDIELTAPPVRHNDETWFPWLMVNGQITPRASGSTTARPTPRSARSPFPIGPSRSCGDARSRSRRTTSTRSSSAAPEPGTSPATSRAGCGTSANSTSTPTSPRCATSRPTRSDGRWPRRSTSLRRRSC